ncbi:MAG: hypothetical protein ACI4E1_00520 [Lachnospira sp.]
MKNIVKKTSVMITMVLIIVLSTTPVFAYSNVSKTVTANSDGGDLTLTSTFNYADGSWVENSSLSFSLNVHDGYHSDDPQHSMITYNDVAEQNQSIYFRKNNTTNAYSRCVITITCDIYGDTEETTYVENHNTK